MSVAISNLIGFILKCDSGKLPGRMLLGGAPTQLMPRRCRMCLRGRDGSDLARGFSARVVAIGKNGTHAVMHTLGIRCMPACVSFLTARWLTRAFVIRYSPSCLSFLTARWHISIRNLLHASVPVVSAGTMAHQHSHAKPGLVSVFSDGTMTHASSTAAAEDLCPLLLGKKHTAATP